MIECCYISTESEVNLLHEAILMVEHQAARFVSSIFAARFFKVA